MRIFSRLLFAALVCGGSLARADVALLLEEQIGPFWRMNPDHAAIYLSRVCVASLDVARTTEPGAVSHRGSFPGFGGRAGPVRAASAAPVALRRCGLEEQGAVISRYHSIDGYDWVAIPLLPYLYAVETAGHVPREATAREISTLRETYRRAHLESIAPEGSRHAQDWRQLAGEAYDRTIYAFQIPASPQQDDALIRALNSRPNKNRFNIVFRNCADFAAQILDFYFPDSVHRSLDDLGIMTPAHVARSLMRYAKTHQLPLRVFEIPQVPGTEPRSKPIHLRMPSPLRLTPDTIDALER